MKYLLLVISTALVQQVIAQHKLEKLWETDTIIAIPESVLPHKGRLYISLIDGSPWGADGRGGIGIIDPEGRKYDGTWVMGLNAPKGMGISGDHIYVADLSDVVVIDLANGKIARKIAVPGASGLNDVTVSDDGIVYVSDSKTGNVWSLKNDKPELFLDNQAGVNGLKAVGKDLVIAAGKNFIKADPSKKITRIADLPQGGDGIEPIGNGDYLVTSWSGYIFYVKADGTVETLLNTSAEKKNTADIGYDPVNRIIYVPTFNARTIVAYRLN